MSGPIDLLITSRARQIGRFGGHRARGNLEITRTESLTGVSGPHSRAAGSTTVRAAAGNGLPPALEYRSLP